MFERGEYAARVRLAQAEMAKRDLAALLLTTEADVRYYTGFLTRFWESPTRPWFVILPSVGAPIAVIPEIGAALMGRTWVTDIRTWASPDLRDDGVSLLCETLREVVGGGHVIGGRVGTPMQAETHLRMPLADWAKVTAAFDVVSDGGLARDQRMIKSPAEVECIRAACGVATRAFARVPEVAGIGTPLAEVFRRFQILCLDEGADHVPYIAGAAGPDGYSDVISPAGDVPLARGDVLMLDTGVQKQGYFSDFDRNFAVGAASDLAQSAHGQLCEAVQAGFAAARPGARISDLFAAMDAVCGSGAGAGRMGHGLGQQLTEWPSIIPSEQTVLRPGMVLTLEPSVVTRGDALMVHEENIVVTEDGAAWLNTPAAGPLPVVA